MNITNSYDIVISVYNNGSYALIASSNTPSSLEDELRKATDEVITKFFENETKLK